MVAPVFLGGSGYTGMAHVDRAFARHMLPERHLVFFSSADDVSVDTLDTLLPQVAGDSLAGCLRLDDLDTLEDMLSERAVGGVVLHSEDPLALLRSWTASRLHGVLSQAVKADVPVYAGGPGAVTLGCDIRPRLLDDTVPAYAARGAGLLRSYSVYTGYTASQSLHHLVNRLNTPLIAMPQTAGVAFDAGRLTAYGTAPVDVLTAEQSVSVYPGASYRIA